MENIIKLETIQDYNNLLGTKTLHPLVSVADLSTLNGTPLDRLYNRNAVGNDKKIQNMVAHHLFSLDMVDRIPDHCNYFCNKLVDLFHTADSGHICYHGTCQRQQFRKGDGQQQR